MIDYTTNNGINGATSPAKAQFVQNKAGQAYKGPSIVDYLKLSGSGNDRGSLDSLASQYGIQNYQSGTAESNTALLAALRGGNPLASGNPPTGGNLGDTPTPPAPAPAPAPSAVDTAFASYINSLTNNTGVTDAKTKYNDFIANRDQGVNNLEGQGRGIPLSLVRGQQSKLLNQSGIEANRLQGDINIAQDSYKNLNEAQKARYDFEQGKVDATSKANPTFELSPGQERYTFDKATGKYAKTASTSPALKEISGGGTLYDPSTGKAVYTAPKIANPGSGGGTPTQQRNAIISSGEQKLNEARGDNGYTDPYLYKDAYESWVDDKMGTAAQFLTKFPPKNYVDPKASGIPNLLPTFLQNKTKTSARTR